MKVRLTESQLIDLIKEIAVKSTELPQSFEFNMDIEKKPNKQIKVNYISDAFPLVP